MMIHPLLAAALALSPPALQSAPAARDAAPAPAASIPPLSRQNAALLRCSAAFALVSYGQANGDEAARKWPAIDPRGREFFVRAMAQLMDDTGHEREAIARLAEAEAQRLIDRRLVDEVMPTCLVMLDASGV